MVSISAAAATAAKASMAATKAPISGIAAQMYKKLVIVHKTSRLTRF